MELRIWSYNYGEILIKNFETILTKCRICGCDYSKYQYFPWGRNGQDPTFDYCVCCGVEFGNFYGDWCLERIVDYRRRWIEEGSVWSEPKEKPHGWSLEASLAGLPEELFLYTACDNAHSPKLENILTPPAIVRIKSRCLVCGNNLGEKGRPFGECCPCCGVQFSIEDRCLLGILTHRRNWTAKGAKWVDPSKMPTEWRLEDALATLPRELFNPEDAVSE